MVIYPRKLIPQILQNRAISNESSKCYPTKLISMNIINKLSTKFLSHGNSLPYGSECSDRSACNEASDCSGTMIYSDLGVTSLVWQSSSD